MAWEIERKFIAAPTVLSLCRSGTRVTQGYLYTDTAVTLRIRRADGCMVLTWKGPRTWATREEIEVEVARAVGETLLASVPSEKQIEKTRYRVVHADATWDVDVFEGRHSGLILAEIELAHADQPVVLPPWVTVEVTADERYRNSRLAAAATLGLVSMPDYASVQQGTGAGDDGKAGWSLTT